MTLPVYIMPRVPGAIDTAEWTSFCHNKPGFVVIKHSNIRHVGRWGCADRKRKFGVTHWRHGRMGIHPYDIGWYATLEKAQAVAQKYVETRND